MSSAKLFTDKAVILVSSFLLVLVLTSRAILAASENSKKPDSPPGQDKKIEFSQESSKGNSNSQNSNSGQSNGAGNNASSNGQENGRGTGDHKITICHLPPGNPSNAQAIDIDRNAWDKGHSPHNAHKLDFVVDGDHPCPPKSGGNNNNNGNNSSGNSSSGNSSSNGSSTSEAAKKGSVKGASVLAATDSQNTLFEAIILQLLGATIVTLGSVIYGKRQAA